MNEIADISLAPQGQLKIDWVRRNMPVLRSIEADFAREKPLAGLKVVLSVHLEAKTAYLCKVLQAGGAQMCVTGSNPLSTQDDVAAALAASGLEVHAIHGSAEMDYQKQLLNALAFGPNIIIDDGGELLELIRTHYPQLLPDVIGGCEETTTGITRINKLAKAGLLPFPMMLVNDADCKHLFDNRYGTGQSVWDGIMRTTNLMVTGKRVVVCGYGWCGKGVAMRADGLGARVVVTETDPICALEAVMDGFEVMPMRDGAILSNAGHFDVEIDMAGLEKLAVRKYEARHNITGYELPNGKTIFVLGEGRLVNLACADGHPAEIMDMSFAIQALSAEYLARHRGALPVEPIRVPREIDDAVARRKLASLNVEIDGMTDVQKEYMGV